MQYSEDFQFSYSNFWWQHVYSRKNIFQNERNQQISNSRLIKNLVAKLQILMEISAAPKKGFFLEECVNATRTHFKKDLSNFHFIEINLSIEICRKIGSWSKISSRLLQISILSWINIQKSEEISILPNFHFIGNGLYIKHITSSYLMCMIVA